MRPSIRHIAIFLCLALLLTASALAEPYLAIVTAQTATVYADQSSAKKLGTLKQYASVTVEDISGGTARVAKSGRTGYMDASALTPASDLGRSATVTKNTSVYRTASKKSASVAVKAGFAVNLLATKGSWAMVERNGVIGFMDVSAVSVNADSSTVVTETFAATVSADRVTVYKSASENSDPLGTLKKGASLTVRAYTGDWAYVERNGRTGYCRLSALTRQTATPTAAPAASADSYLNDTSLSVERRIYLYLTREMGLNTAAACGLLANIERECDFNVNDQSYDGGYGIVQWTGERNTQLKQWCAKQGYDYTRLSGQLRFLKYELETTQTKTLSYLKNISNTASGAYDAAYYFCYYFEIPANRAANSVRRGELARNTYWVKYAQ